MAAMDTRGLDALMKSLDLEAQRIDELSAKAVEAGAKVLKAAQEATAPVRTGGLAGHIKIGKPQHDAGNGYYRDVYPDGKNPRGERYATIGFVLEYGRSNMPARPWMRVAGETSEQAVVEAMAEVLKRE